MKKILSFVISMLTVIHCFIITPQSSVSAQNEKYGICYVNIIDESGKQSYMKAIIRNDCLMVDIQSISSKLGLECNILGKSLLKEKYNEMIDGANYFLTLLRSEHRFSDSENDFRITISKKECDLVFTFYENQSIASAVSPVYGKLSFDMGGKVTAVTDENGGVHYYVPIFAFMEIFNSGYYIDSETDCIYLFGTYTTVMDIMHMQDKLSDYESNKGLLDAINDNILTALGMLLGGWIDGGVDYIFSYDWLNSNEYIIVKSTSSQNEFIIVETGALVDISDMYDGNVYVEFDSQENKYRDVCRNNYYSKREVENPNHDMFYENEFEYLTMQMCCSDTDEVKAISDSASSTNDQKDSLIGAYDVLKEYFIDADSKLNNMAEGYNDILKSGRYVSLTEFESAYNDYKRCKKIKSILNANDAFNMAVGTSASMFLTAGSLIVEISSAQDNYVDCVTTFLDYSEKVLDEADHMGYDTIRERLAMYKSSKDSILNAIMTSDEMQGVINGAFVETFVPHAAALSFAKNATKWGVNALSGGAFDFKDAYFNSMYNEIFCGSTEKTVRKYLKESEFDIETYKKLEWTRLKSCYVALENEAELYRLYVEFHKKNIFNQDDLAQAEKIYNVEKGEIDRVTPILAEYMAIILYGENGTTPDNINLAEKIAAENNKYLISNKYALYQKLTGTVYYSEDEDGEDKIPLEYVYAELTNSHPLKTFTTDINGDFVDPSILEVYVPDGEFLLEITNTPIPEPYIMNITVTLDEKCDLGDIIICKPKTEITSTQGNTRPHNSAQEETSASPTETETVPADETQAESPVQPTTEETTPLPDTVAPEEYYSDNDYSEYLDDFGLLPEDTIAWMEYNGHVYALYDYLMTPSMINMIYEYNNSVHLVTITDSDEQAAVEDLIAEGGRPFYYTGGCVDVDGNLYWINGESNAYSNWYEGCPDVYGDPNYSDVVVIYRGIELPAQDDPDFGTWFDTIDNEFSYLDIYSEDEGYYGFILEWDQPDVHF